MTRGGGQTGGTTTTGGGHAITGGRITTLRCGTPMPILMLIPAWEAATPPASTIATNSSFFIRA